jgi:hypothetical protein
MFLAAVLRNGEEQAPAKVRNMSPHGAMVESSLTPARGTSVYLIRGMLVAAGTVVWSSPGRCGLRFDSELSVKEWLAAPGVAEQERVDKIVALVKAGATVPAGLGGSETKAEMVRSREQLVDDLGVLILLIQDLEDDLASSDQTVARHGLKLQNLDIAMQMVRAIAKELDSDLSGHPVSLAKLADLRIACAKALGTHSMGPA